MSPVGIEHEENFEACHHCHITAPIPLADLIKTHPLRSSVAKNGGDEDESNFVASENEAKAKRNSGPVHSLLEEVASKKFNLKKTGEVASTSRETPPASLDRKDKSVKAIKPVHSFLHHVSSASIYKQPANRNSQTPNDAHSSSDSPRNSARKNSQSPDVILNASELNQQNESSSRYSHRNSSVGERKSLKTVKHVTDSETQTSRTSSVSRPYFTKCRYSVSEFSSFILSHRRSYKRCDKFFCSLPSGLLFAGYGLLIVIGIVVGVALSQRERSFQSSAFPRRPNIPGARSAPVSGAPRERVAIRAPIPRTRISSAGRRRVGSVKRVVPQQNVIAAPAPAPTPVQAPVQVAAPVQVFADEDFDYLEEIGLNDPDLNLGNINAVNHPQAKPLPRPQAAQPTQAFRPVEINPQFRPQAQAPAQEVRSFAQAPRRQQSASPRKGTSNTFRQEFNIDPREEEALNRGQKEPEVKIIKSWSNRNADGTFSWGYLNTDGSFKNETKGIDCVVRGVYGYIDEATGETVSFPYESGNPCDPDAPDYYLDYDEGTINSGGRQVAQIPRKVVGGAVRNRA